MEKQHAQDSLRRALQGARIGRPHRLEQGDELLARRIVIPFAVAADDFQQFVDARLRGSPPASSASASSKRA